MRLIDADALKERLNRLPNDDWYDGVRLVRVEEIIDGMPTEEVNNGVD